MSNQERVGYSPGWSVEEDQDGASAGPPMDRPGPEVEVGITEPAWAATDPVDPGTRRVVTDGLRILHDPDGRLAALAGAATGHRP